MSKEKLVGIYRDAREHIIFDRNSHTICGKKAESVEFLSDYVDVDERYDNICSECKDEYKRWKKSGQRAPTVECKCDIISQDGVERCESIVSAYRARELSHPIKDRNVPVCPNCYKWIRSIGENGVETSYKNAEPWLEKSRPEVIENVEENS